MPDDAGTGGDAKPKLTPEELEARKKAALERAAKVKAEREAGGEAAGGAKPKLTPEELEARKKAALERAAKAKAEREAAGGAAGAAAKKPVPKKPAEPEMPPLPDDPFEAAKVRQEWEASDRKANAWPFPAMFRAPDDDADVREIHEQMAKKVVAVGNAAGKPVVYVRPDAWFDVIRFAKDHLHFDHLPFVSCADYPDAKDATKDVLEVHAQLWSYRRNRDLIVKTHVPRAGATIDSLVPLYAGANWHEREAFDMFGIRFAGHPFMTRIFLPDTWRGHPLLKDYDETEQFIGLGEDGLDVVYTTPGPDRW